jgi:hypothetical protein
MQRGRIREQRGQSCSSSWLGSHHDGRSRKQHGSRSAVLLSARHAGQHEDTTPYTRLHHSRQREPAHFWQGLLRGDRFVFPRHGWCRLVQLLHASMHYSASLIMAFRWIWHALDVVKPRVVIVEIQELWLWTVTHPFGQQSLSLLTQQMQEAKTRPYKPDFSADSIPQMGASIAAFNVQAMFRGYRLIGCVSAGFNAIFLRNDIAPDAFPTSVIPYGDRFVPASPVHVTFELQI